MKGESPFANPTLLAIMMCTFASSALASSQDLFGYGVRCPAVAGACLTETGSFENTTPTRREFARGSIRRNLLCRITRLSISGWTGIQSAIIPERSGGLSFGTTFTLPLPGWGKDRLALGLGMFYRLLRSAHRFHLRGLRGYPSSATARNPRGTQERASGFWTLFYRLRRAGPGGAGREIRVVPEQLEPCRAVSGTSS